MCLRSASTSDVPFCAGLVAATIVVLSRLSEGSGMCSNAGFGCGLQAPELSGDHRVICTPKYSTLTALPVAHVPLARRWEAPRSGDETLQPFERVAYFNCN